MKWYVLCVVALVVFTGVSLTALDKQDERTCREAAAARASVSQSLYRSQYGAGCDGFLPW